MNNERNRNIKKLVFDNQMLLTPTTPCYSRVCNIAYDF